METRQPMINRRHALLLARARSFARCRARLARERAHRIVRAIHPLIRAQLHQHIRARPLTRAHTQFRTRCPQHSHSRRQAHMRAHRPARRRARSLSPHRYQSCASRPSRRRALHRAPCRARDMSYSVDGGARTLFLDHVYAALRETAREPTRVPSIASRVESRRIRLPKRLLMLKSPASRVSNPSTVTRSSSCAIKSATRRRKFRESNSGLLPFNRTSLRARTLAATPFQSKSRGKPTRTVVLQETYTDRGIAGELINRKAQRVRATGRDERVGHFAGFAILLARNPMERVDLVIKGATTHFANVSDSPLGTIRSLEHTVQSFEQVGNDCTASMQATQKRLKDLNEQIGQPFEYAEDLAEKLKRQQTLIEQLDLNKNQAANTLDSNQEAAEIAEYSETVSQNTSVKRERGIHI